MSRLFPSCEGSILNELHRLYSQRLGEAETPSNVATARSLSSPVRDLSSVPALKESGLPKLDQELLNFR